MTLLELLEKTKMRVDEPSRPNMKQRVLDYMKSCGPCSPTEMVKNGGLNRDKNLYNVLRELLEEGLIVATGTTKTGATIYSVV